MTSGSFLFPEKVCRRERVEEEVDADDELGLSATSSTLLTPILLSNLPSNWLSKSLTLLSLVIDDDLLRMKEGLVDDADV